MSIYVYITDQCRKDAQKQNYSDHIERFKARIERDQNTEAFDRFPPPHLKKRFERQIRMVADEKHVDQHTVVVFLRVFVRGGSEYAQFGDSDYRIVPGVDKMQDELSEAALRIYIESRQDPPPPPPPSPSEMERGYLDTALSAGGNIYTNSHCCETHRWVETIQTSKFSNRLSDFVEPVFETLDTADEGISERRCKTDNSYGILFRSIPESKTVLLFTPFHGSPPIDEVREQFGSLTEAGSPFNLEHALRKAKRAYAHELLLNPDAWFEIQKDSKGNMALSPEEINVLDSARAAEGGGFPLFINGRAGSGKSTILQYLFSEFLYHHLTNPSSQHPPLLLACNNDLLAQSERSVRDLLLARRRQTDPHSSENWLKSDDVHSSIRRSFRNFHHALLDLLLPEERELFPLSNCVDYGRFKAWWERKFSKIPSARKLYNPDTSWHVIRTYIKGSSSEGLLEPEDYREIPAKHKSVSDETYSLVFEKVWPRYEEDQKSKGLWDYQDVTRKVLEANSIPASHPAVFCDEAQDFTRIELEAIDRYCLFNERSIHAHDAGRVPIAFAGDPFQTLNPTGFRWESTKAFFAEKFIKNYDGQKSTRELNFQELRYNYRSSRNVVQFCNTLQLVRSVVFDIRDIKPQIHWQEEADSPSVVWFDRSKADILDILKEQSEIRIIVPCEEGDEAKWVRENGLADYVEFDEADVPKNVVSPVRVKGLEFTRVVIFGFGGACPELLKKAIRENRQLEGDEAIEPQYFLNRLYVSASRPRKRLFIIDHQKDFDDLWKPIFSNQENLTVRSYDTEAWENELGRLVPGERRSWEADREDPAETAEKLADEGRLRKDRVLLRQAAQSFESANLSQKAKRCRAEALELEESWIDAAKLWEEFGDASAALKAAWEERKHGTAFVLQLSERFPEIKPTLEYSFCKFLADSEATFDDVVPLVSAMNDEIVHVRTEEILTRPSWTRAVEQLIEKTLGFSDVGPNLWKIVFERLQAVAEAGLRIDKALLGKVAFAGNQLKDAYRLWSDVPAERRSGFDRDYLRSRFAALDYPDSLDAGGELLKKLQSKADAQAIIELYRREGDAGLKPRHYDIIAHAHLICHDLAGGAQLINRVHDNLVLADFVEQISVAPESHELLSVALGRLANSLLASDDIETVITMFGEGSFRKRKLEGFFNLLQGKPLDIRSTLIDALCTDTEFREDDPSKLQRLAQIITATFDGGLSWATEVHPLKVGKALEIIGFFKETLPYYEKVQGAVILSDTVRLLAKERWIYVKLQQAVHERDHGSRRKAEALLQEAKVEFAALAPHAQYSRIDSLPKSLPDDLPPVEQEPFSAQEPAATEDSRKPDFALDEAFGPFRMKVNSAGSRLNLEHLENMEQLSVKSIAHEVSHEGRVLVPASDLSFEVPGWGLSLRFERGSVELIRKNGMKISVPFACTTMNTEQP